MVQKRGSFILMCPGHEHVDNGGFVIVIGEPNFNSLFYEYTKHTYLLTIWSSVLLEKLNGSQLVKKFHAFYETLRFITTFTSACLLSQP